MAQTIFSYQNEILSCFKNLQILHPKKYNAETTKQAVGFVKWLEDDCFLYWLKFFADIMPHIDILYSQLQKIESDPVKIQAVENFKTAIENIRAKLPPVVESTSTDSSARKKRRPNDENLNISAREVCDIIIFQITERFAFKDYLSGAKLFLKKNYIEYSKSLPIKDIEQFCKAFPMIDKEILKKELNIFYSRSEIINNPNISGCLKTLNFILSLNLDSAFKEITKALRILGTIPITTAEPERYFSKLKLIKSFLRNTMTEERLSALAMLSIESAMVQIMIDFNKKLIEKFIADKPRRMEFHDKN